MQFETFFVPLRGGEGEKEALNAFLRSRRVLKVEHALAEGGLGVLRGVDGGKRRGGEGRGVAGGKGSEGGLPGGAESGGVRGFFAVAGGSAGAGGGGRGAGVRGDDERAAGGDGEAGGEESGGDGADRGGGGGATEEVWGAFLEALRGEVGLSQRHGGGREGKDADAVGGNTIRQEDGPDGAGPSPNAAGSCISERGEA